MGAADYVERNLRPLRPPGAGAVVVARPPSASPAVGSHTRHKLEQEQLIREALGEPAPLARAAAVPQGEGIER